VLPSRRSSSSSAVENSTQSAQKSLLLSERGSGERAFLLPPRRLSQEKGS